MQLDGVVRITAHEQHPQPGRCCRTAFSSSRPPIAGITTSLTSKWMVPVCVWAYRTASVPEFASRTSYPCISSQRRRPCERLGRRLPRPAPFRTAAVRLRRFVRRGRLLGDNARQYQSERRTQPPQPSRSRFVRRTARRPRVPRQAQACPLPTSLVVKKGSKTFSFHFVRHAVVPCPSRTN